MILSSSKRAHMVNEINTVANNFGFTFIEGRNNNRAYEFVLSGNNVNYIVIVSAGTGNNSDLITFKDMNTDGFFRVFLSNHEQIAQFISCVWINYLVNGESMCKVSKISGWKRNNFAVLAYGSQMILHKNVLQQAMIRDMLKVVNATIDREGRLIINLD